MKRLSCVLCVLFLQGAKPSTTPLVKAFPAQVVGVDLSALHVQRASRMAAVENEARKKKGLKLLRVTFVEGSFLDLPNVAAILDPRKFTHVWSQVAFCHVHKFIDKVCSVRSRRKKSLLILFSFLFLILCALLLCKTMEIPISIFLVWRGLVYLQNLECTCLCFSSIHS